MGKATLDDLLKEQKKTNELLKKMTKRPIQVSLESVKTERADAKEALNSMEKIIADQTRSHL